LEVDAVRLALQVVEHHVEDEPVRLGAAMLLLELYIHFVERWDELVGHEARQDEHAQVGVDVLVSLVGHGPLLVLVSTFLRLAVLLEWVLEKGAKHLELSLQFVRNVNVRLKLAVLAHLRVRRLVVLQDGERVQQVLVSPFLVQKVLAAAAQGVQELLVEEPIVVVDVILVLHVVLFDENLGVVQVQFEYFQIVFIEVFDPHLELRNPAHQGRGYLLSVLYDLLERLHFGLLEGHPLVLHVEVVDDVEAIVKCEQPEVLGLDGEDIQKVVDDGEATGVLVVDLQHFFQAHRGRVL
jgi:hypothetical protein